MILTEEQRGALARAIDYINETDLPVGELDGFDREVLRSMVTTDINYGPDVMKMIELLAAGEHDQWADWAQSILDSEPGLSDGRKAAWPEMIATPYENLSEELKDKDRREVYLRSGDALAEIERLRADLEQAEICIRARMECIDDQAAYIKELESSLDEAEALTKKNAELMNGYLAKIRELEDTLVEYLAADIAYAAGVLWSRLGPRKEEYRERAREQLQSEGLIGPDARPRSWQITEERKAAIDRGTRFLVWSNAKTNDPETEIDLKVLWAMLT
ncbi:MAG: hypothetical protein PHD55_11940, partial [Methanoregula sp.]|nr:hypothetical protein [Methanoregula sp.]